MPVIMTYNKYTNHKFIFFIVFLSLAYVAQGAIPSGYYYYARGKKKAELKTILHQISAPITELDYGSGPGFTWQGFYKTDQNADGTVKDMYSDSVRSFSGYSSVKGMAIEHSFPKSWWGAYENMAYKDLFHLYPADAYTNGIKNNLPLGEVTGTPMLDNGKSKIGKNGFGTAYTDNSFEPADEYKGDFARSYLYISTIYENLAPLWNSPMLTNTVYPVWKPWAIDLLLKWSRQDPVSSKELDRNDSIYTIQGNRNPFIDFPDMAEYIWGNDTTVAFTYPEETGAFLVAPRRMFKLDFGVIFLNITKSLNFTVQGINITSPLTLSFSRSSSSLSLSTNTISVADAQAGFNIQVNYQPTISGATTDTLLIEGGGLLETTRIPVKAIATSEFITMEPTNVTPVGGTLQWLEDPQATDYKVSLYQGDLAAGDLIISGYIEGASNDKAIELYNGTGTPIDLSKYTLRKQTNGMGDYVVTQKLTGTLPNNQTYVIVYNPPMSSTPVNDALKSKANMFADSLCAFNGNDAVALFRNGVQIDVVGKLNGGADYSWGTDKILKRKADVTHPTSIFDLSEWSEFAYTDFAQIGAHTMSLATSSSYIFQDKSVGDVNEFAVDKLSPKQKYTYKVVAVHNDGTQIPSVNTQQLKTTALEVPLALEASEITSNSFKANWEESIYANNYLMDVYKLTGSKIQETEGFNSVGANGKPLPTDWDGTASGNYTTTTSSGQAPPSIALKNNGEWLQTKQFPDIISKLTFMYRFPSAGTGSSFKVEGQNQAGWSLIETISYSGSTSKYYPSYTFTPEKGYTSVRFTYYKSSGNLALDDIMIEHGKVDTLFVNKDKFVTGNQSLVENLDQNTNYFYRLRANLNSSYSAISAPIKVLTLSATGTTNLNANSFKIGTLPNGIRIFDLKGNETIRLYLATGVLLSTKTAQSSSLIIPVNFRGIFILQIFDGNKIESYKIVR